MQAVEDANRGFFGFSKRTTWDSKVNIRLFLAKFLNYDDFNDMHVSEKGDDTLSTSDFHKLSFNFSIQKNFSFKMAFVLFTDGSPRGSVTTRGNVWPFFFDISWIEDTLASSLR